MSGYSLRTAEEISASLAAGTRELRLAKGWRQVTPGPALRGQALAPGPGGEQTMTVAGEGRAPGRSHLLRLAPAAGIAGREDEAILEGLASAVAGWRTYARRVGVGKASAATVEKAVEEALAVISCSPRSRLPREVWHAC